MMTGLKRRMALVLWLGLFTVPPAAWSQEASEESESNEVDFLIEATSHGESRIRQNAVMRLSEMEEKPFDALVPVLAKGTKIPAAIAALVLRNLKTENEPIPAETLADLYEILSDPATEVWRWNITATLLAGVPNNPRTADPADSDEEAITIRETGIAEASLKDHVDLWTWGVNHPDPMIQLPSLRALQKTGEHGKPAQSAVAGLLHRQGPPLTSIVLKPEIITDAKIGIEQPLPIYDPLVILETLVAINADPQLLVEPLTRLTHHVSEYVRLDAAAMLGKIDAEELPTDPRPLAARVLANLAVRPYGKVRVEAVRELGNIGEPAADVLPALIALLQDGNGRVRVQAAVSLGKMGTAAAPALPALRTALRFAELDTREAAAAIQDAIENIEMADRDEETMI